MQTPLDPNLKDAIYDKVYEPSEDSFLLIDALELEIDQIRQLRPLLCLEIGSGSGVVITALAMALRSQPCCFFAVDINAHACSATQRMCAHNSAHVEVMRMDLSSALIGRELFDVIIFNPPYVVTESEEIGRENEISKSWAGGMRGREIIDKLFEQVPRILAKNGRFYLLLLRENGVDYVMERFRKVGMEGAVVLERKIPGEYLYVLKFEKT